MTAVASVLVIGTFTALYRRSERRRVEFEGRVAAKLHDGTQALAAAAALNQRLEVARRRAFEAFDAAHRDEGEASWAQARAAASKMEANLKRAQAALEAALALDQANEHAREALGAALF